MRHDLAGLHDEVGGEPARHFRQRNVDGDGNDAEVGPGEHHHRPRGEAVKLLAQRPEKLRMAGEAEADVVQRLLLDRVGHHGGGLAAMHEADGRTDGFDDLAAVAPLDMARRPDQVGRIGKAGNRLGEESGSLAGRRGGDAYVAPHRFGAPGQHAAVAHEDEGRNAGALTRQPRVDRDVRTDACRFADRQRKRAASAHGYSMTASERRSRR